MTTQDQIIALADELGGEVRLDYSGRGMFGARCMGIVCEDSEQVILNALGRGLPRGKVDSMDTRKIVYWPEIKAAMRSVGLLPGAREVDLLAENERLRAALAHIEAGSAEYPWLQRSQINQIAKSALLGKGDA